MGFDTVDHSILVNKLRHYGVRRIVIYWLTSYLTGRKQISIFHRGSSQAVFSCRANDAHGRRVVVWQQKIQIHCVLEF